MYVFVTEKKIETLQIHVPKITNNKIPQAAHSAANRIGIMPINKLQVH